MKHSKQTIQPLLSLQATARYCDVSVKTVRRWIQAGDLVAYKLGSQWRISIDDLEFFLYIRRKKQ
jgi:excisionase family DNA binding protein